MRRSATGVFAALLLLAGPALANDPPARQPSPAQLAQQEKMRNCNAEAARQDLKGDARSAFMRTCLSGSTTPAAAAPAATPASPPAAAPTTRALTAPTTPAAPATTPPVAASVRAPTPPTAPPVATPTTPAAPTARPATATAPATR